MIVAGRTRGAWDVPLLGLLLLSTVLGELKMPGLGIGVQNLILPGAAAVLLFLHRDDVGPVVLRHRWLLALLTGLLAWTAIAALASAETALGLRMVIKAFTYALPFLAFLVVLSCPGRQRALHLTVLVFLGLLAFGGVMETAFPDGAVYRLLRSPESLAIQPRTSSFMPWPNPFGVAMVSGIALAGALFTRGWIGWRGALICQALFAIEVAQSGSRNAWATLLVVLVVVVALSSLRLRALVPALVFVAALLVLPVAAWQAGLRDRIPVIEALVPKGARTSTSIAPVSLSLELRGRLWRAAADNVARRPWLGIGPGVFSTKVSPGLVEQPGLNTHSLPLNFLVELGLPGLTLVSLALLVALRSGHASGGPVHPATAALGALLVGQLVDCFLYDPTSVTLLLFFGASAAIRPDASAPRHVPVEG
jgi:O-antigen ligase